MTVIHRRRNRTTTTVAIATFAMVFALAMPATAEQKMDKENLQTVKGEVVMLTPTVLHLEVDGEIDQFEVTQDSEMVAGLTTDDFITVWYYEDPTGKVIVGKTERTERPSQEMAATETTEQREKLRTGETGDSARSADTRESTRARGETRMTQDEEEMRRGESATAASERSQTSERSRLPQTASTQPLLLIVGLLAVTLAGGLALLRRS